METSGPDQRPDDPRAFETWVREHEPVLRSIALSLCQDPADARDIVQDTFERALKGFAAKPPGASPRSWLATILRNRFIDSWRRAALARKAEEALTTLERPIEEVQAAPGWASITEEQLAAAVAALDEEFRAVYVLHAIEGRSYQEIATALGIPRPTVGTRLLRARRKLRDLLLPQVDDADDKP